MPYVYKYQDKVDNIVKYVGIIKCESNFPKRFYQHKNDPWYLTSEWNIYYFKVGSIADAEALESHFISLYQSNEYYNKAKATWGELTFAPTDIAWKLYEPINKTCSENEWWFGRMLDLRNEAQRLGSAANELFRQCDEILNQRSSEKKQSIVQWFRAMIVEVPYQLRSEYPGIISILNCYQSYEDFCMYVWDNRKELRGTYEITNMYEFDDVDEFWDAVCNTSAIGPYVFKDGLHSVVTANSTDEVNQIKERTNLQLCEFFRKYMEATP